MKTREKVREVVAYLLKSEPTDDAEVIDNYTDSLMVGIERDVLTNLKRVLAARMKRWST